MADNPAADLFKASTSSSTKWLLWLGVVVFILIILQWIKKVKKSTPQIMVMPRQ